MVFSSGIFLFFFLPVTLLFYKVFKSLNAKNTVLLAASLFFYAFGEPVYVFLLLLSILLNWIFGLLVASGKNRKIWLVVSIAFNLSLLFVFKYLGFVCKNLSLLLNRNIDVNIALPIGISFFTFQAMSYVIDVYRGQGEAQKKIRNVALYISLFPQLIAGPIVRYETVATQLSYRTVDPEKVTSGVRRFMSGFVKKVVLANNFSLVADCIFNSAVTMGGALHWIGAIAYSLQILFDFSGYSDMAIGLGKIFGFDFLENFDFPYISKSISEFWRRWHISLGTWFRDYLYIPLGGNRVSKIRNILNLFIVWLLTGIWHGANWTFILWGLLYFVLLVIEKITHLDKLFEKKLHFIPHIYTLFFVLIGWVLFRSSDISSAVSYLSSMFGQSVLPGEGSLIKQIIFENIVFVVLSLVFLIPWDRVFNVKENKLIRNSKDVLLLILFILSVSYVMKGSYNPFIYFNF